MKVLILANFATQFLRKAFLKVSNLEGCSIDFIDGEYDSVIQTLLSINGSQKFDVALVIHDSFNLENRFFSLDEFGRANFSANEINLISGAIKHALDNGVGKILISNLYRTGNQIHGSNAMVNPQSFDYQREVWNQGLYELVSEDSRLGLIDLDRSVANDGIKNCIDQKLRALADHPWTFKFTESFAIECILTLRIDEGFIHKCLILDLDDTLWGGVVADEGFTNIEIGKTGIGKIYRELQLYCRELKRRGIILCVCSKNSEENAKEPFRKNAEMILQENDFSVFVANWENKADNIKFIKDVLNIGYDSMVFLDDNPMERSIVEENIKGILVPNIPKDPELILPFLIDQFLFLTNSKSVISSTKDRNKQYQIEAKRVKERKKTVSLDSFLSNLKMQCSVDKFNDNNLSRIVELFQRSNQFNLTTIRYKEEELKVLMTSSDFITWSFQLQDKFGNHGLVSLVIARYIGKKMVIESWVMSCRVLNRTLESFIFNIIRNHALDQGVDQIEGRYIPSKKNQIVANLYLELGFLENKQSFTINLKESIDRPTHIVQI